MRKMVLPYALLLLLLFQAAIAFAQSCTATGTYKIGPTGTYPSITAAVAALRTSGIGNPVILELQAGYTPAGETFPLSFNNIPCMSESRSLTIRPETGAVNLTITGVGNPIIDLNNARYIHFDGRPGGTGAIRQLTIVNNFNTVVQFINDASFNSFSYVNIQGGGIQFGTSNQSVTNGNSNNTVRECAVYASAPGGIGTVIRSQGTAGKKNTNNKILNNLIYNYQVNGAVQLHQHTGPWEITGNHIYYTTATTSGNVEGININDSTSSGFIIHNNFIGGTAPNCGGTPNTYNAFIGINVVAGSDSYTSIQGNTIANVKLNATWSGNYFAGISMLMGKFKCGNVTGNTIGSQTQPGNITVRGGDDFNIHGIVAGSGNWNDDSGVDTCYIMNNKIGGFYGYQADFNLSQTNYMIGIYIRGQKKGYTDVSYNSIGSPATYSSMLNWISFSENNTYGIYCENMYGFPPLENMISHNEIANLSGSAKGIFIRSGKPQVMNNTIHHLYGNENGYHGSPAGIVGYQLAPGSLISGNTIHSLTWTGQGFEISGIYSLDSWGITVEKNFIHSFQASVPNNTSSTLYGIYFYSGGKQRIQNNMIRLGIDTAGASTISNTSVKGIVLRLDSSIVSNNAVWIGGTGSLESAALNAMDATSTGSRVYNNILVNTRTVPGSSFYNHYALKYEGGNFPAQQFDYNIYHATGNNGYLAFLNVVPYQPASNNFTNIIEWRKASKQEQHSLFYDPKFVNPTGTSTTVNLHLANTNPAEGQGIADPEITDDIDHETRASFSPVDIGADAGNFSLQDGDAPRITHKAFLGNPVPTTFVYTAAITDNGTGVDTTGNNKPRMWFRKKYPATGAWASLPGQFLSGNLNNGVWGFTPDFAAAGVPVAAGDSLEYYFVAQDKGPVINTGYSNVPGTVHTNVNTQTTPPASPLRLLIYGIFPDTVYVGSGQTFTSLTNDGGFFHKAKSYMFDTTRNAPTVIITSDLLESGTHEYTNINEAGPIITIKTNTQVVKQIKNQGTIDKRLITFRNTKNITLDGSVNGSGRYLHFITGDLNPVYTLPALAVYGNGKGMTIRNIIFESNGTTNAGETVGFYGNDFDTLLIEGNLFRNIESSTTSKVGLPNTNLQIILDKASKVIIRKNEFTNFGQAGIYIGQSVFNPSGEVLIDSNHFYYNSAIQPINGRTAIYVEAGLRSIITNNYIGGSQPYCGGTPWTYQLQATTSGQTFRGIRAGSPKYVASSVQNNTIGNIRILNWGVDFIGIHAEGGSFDIGTEQPNKIGNPASDSSIVTKGSATGIFGYIAIYSSDTPYVRVENNIIGGITALTCQGIDFETRRAAFRNNRVQNLNSSGVSGGGYKGMKIWLEKGVIEGNEVLDLTTRQVNELVSWVFGMDLAMTGGSMGNVEVARNKIAGLRSYYNGVFGPQTMTGMRLQFGQYVLHNNQVNISNANMTNLVNIYGIRLEGSGMLQREVYYNTVRIAGLSCNSSSAVLVTSGNYLQHFRNNILYNELGGGNHLALSVFPEQGQPVWAQGASNNNLFVVSDTNLVNAYQTPGGVNLHNWRNLTGGDSASYTVPATNLPAGSLFADPGNNNLNINTASNQSWYVNGKGLPVGTISGDFDAPSGVRSTSIADGATDIGADEFNTTTAPPVMITTGSHVPGGTEQFTMNGRVVASITWGATGVLPDLGEPRFYSGVWPNDTTNNGAAWFANFMNAFWNIPATGGSNYTYSITFHYDSSMLGKVTDVASMVINKKQSGVNGSWTVIQPTIVNTALKTITIHNQTSFSEFTATDANATLQTGVPSPDLVITNAGLSAAAATTGSAITASFTAFNQGIAAAAVNKVYFYLSADNVLTPGTNGDILLESYEVPAGLNSNTGTGPLSKNLVIPCQLAAGNYTLFFVADGAEALQETREDNNTATTALAISIGQTVPGMPVITATPGTVVCTPDKATLTVNAASCTGCTYAWNTGATGNSITATTSGTYTVTATNSCGQATGSQPVVINTTPQVSVSTVTTDRCFGEQVTLTASGAANYTWTGTGLNRTNGNVVVATPAASGVLQYKVVGTSNGCADTVITHISVAPALTPSVNIGYTGCTTGALNFTATSSNGGSGPGYQWLVNNAAAGTGPALTLNNVANGTQVSVVLISNATCANPATATASVTVNCTATAVTNIDGLESYALLPNPSSGLFVVKMKFNQLKKVAARITDMNGRTVYTLAPFNVTGTSLKQVDIRHLPAGIYYLQITVGNQSLTDKLLKQ